MMKSHHQNGECGSSTIVPSTNNVDDQTTQLSHLTSNPLPLRSEPYSLSISSTMVRKEAESFTDACTNSVGENEGSLREQNLQQLNAKLGSVSSIEDDDGSSNSENDDTKYPDCVRVRNNLFLGQESLSEALDALNDVAAMDSIDYQDQLLEHRLSSSIQTTICCNPKLLKLNQAIHQFHSLIRNLTTENDYQTMELLDLHKAVQEKDTRITQLEAAVTKLLQCNSKLKSRNRKSRAMSNQLFEQVREFTANATRKKEELDFAKLALQVRQHELVMANRERTESNFSEIDGLKDFQSDSRSMASTDLENVSVSSSVFDDGVATLKISRTRSSTWGSKEEQEAETSLDRSSTREEKLGASGSPQRNKSEKAELWNKPARSAGRDTSATSPTRKTNSMNPFAQLLGPREAQPYTLVLLAPFELQFVPILLDKGKEISSLDDGKVVSEVFSSRTQSSEATVPSSTAIAFAVCGYHGYDCNANIRPTLGARLLQINKEDLDPSWNVQDLEGHIRSAGQCINMTFRNDSWSNSQKEDLRMAIEEQVRLHPDSNRPTNPFQEVLGHNPFARRRGQSNDGDSSNNVSNNTNPLAFWNFNQNSPSKTEDERAFIGTSNFTDPRDEESDTGNEISEKALSNDQGEEASIQRQPGTVVKIEGLPVGTDRASIMEVVGAALHLSTDEVKTRNLLMVDFVSEDTSACALRFTEYNDHIATLSARLKKGELKIRGKMVSDARVLDGEEEQDYWDSLSEHKKESLQKAGESHQGHSKDAKETEEEGPFKSSMINMGKFFSFR